MGETAEIYALCDPRDGSLRYIGKARRSSNRFATHIRDSRRRDTPVYRWIRKLRSFSLVPELVVLQESCADWKASEIGFIARARAAGYRLLNVADGGDQPLCPPEVRSRNAAYANDPKIRAYRICAKNLAQAIRFAEKDGNTERAAYFAVVLNRIRSMTKEQKIAFSKEWVRRHGELYG